MKRYMASIPTEDVITSDSQETNVLEQETSGYYTDKKHSSHLFNLFYTANT